MPVKRASQPLMQPGRMMSYLAQGSPQASPGMWQPQMGYPMPNTGRAPSNKKLWVDYLQKQAEVNPELSLLLRYVLGG